MNAYNFLMRMALEELVEAIRVMKKMEPSQVEINRTVKNIREMKHPITHGKPKQQRQCRQPKAV